jgi:CxxC motif-containing protein (DUF1111 family)
MNRLLLMIGLQVPLMALGGPRLPTEAPAGFDTPTLATNAGAQSVSNGIAEPAGDSFQLDQSVYETLHDVSTGLGPVYNGRACVECHQNPVSGGASQFTELRVGHAMNGTFINPTVPIDDGAATITGRSILNDRAVVPEAQEKVPATETLQETRAALITLGDGFVEAVADSTLQEISKLQPVLTGGEIHGEAVEVPLFEAPGQMRVGRFGWKDQHGSLLSFIADAYLNEMGVTSRLRPKDTTTIGKVTTDPEDHPDALGLADIDHFAQFIRGTRVPPRDTNLQSTPDTRAGEKVFLEIGCAVCHVPVLITAPAGTVVNGGQFAIPESLGNKIIHPFGDYLMHDIGTAGGIVQTATAQDTAFKFRTAPLWGLRMRPRYMHDLDSLTLEDAIERHQGEARHVTSRFLGLSDTQKQQLFTFLDSL